MNHFAIFEVITGRIVQTCQAPDMVAALTCAQAGQDALEIPGRADDSTHYVEDAGEVTVPHQPVLVAMPPRPSGHHVFDFQTKAWIDPRTLQDLKATQNEAINGWRLTANQTRFFFAGHAIQADPLSRGDIDGVNGIVTLIGALPPGFPNAWKTEANDWVPIPDLATWAGFYGAMVSQGQSNFALAQTLKAAVQAATTADAVVAVTWPV